MSFLDEMDELDDMKTDLDDKRDLMLRNAGWESSSDYPDSYWRWSKSVLHGGRMTCADADEAIRVESYLRPKAEIRRYDKKTGKQLTP